jgi:hypothetical protein
LSIRWAVVRRLVRNGSHRAPAAVVPFVVGVLAAFVAYRQWQRVRAFA